MMLHLLRYSTNENDYNKTICLKEREMFNWNNIGFFFTGDQKKTIKSLPMFSAYADISLDDLPIW